MQLELDAALRGKSTVYTNAPRFVLRGTVKQGTVESLALTVDGANAQSIAPKGGKFEASVARDEDRAYALSLTCARLDQPIALTVVRDARKPALLDSKPAAASAFARAFDLDVELKFDEAIDRVDFEGVAMTVTDATARRHMTAPQLKGPWHPQWTAWDKAGDSISGALDCRVR